MRENQNGAGNRHHRRKGPLRILKHKIKRKLLKHKWLGPSLLIALAVVVATGFWMVRSAQSQSGKRLSAKAQFNAGSGYRDIVYKGNKYRYNNRITTLLFAGLDSEGEITAGKRFTEAPRADSISLVVLDEFNRRMTVIALNRDTMTKIHKFTLDGFDRGLFTDHLGYAYTYGEGGEISCQNVCSSVSELLYGVPINEYAVINRSSLSAIADVIGDVRVTVPNDDLADRGYAAGETAIINANNIETFVRSRDVDIDLSNVGRMERQQAYIDGAMAQIREQLEGDASAVWNALEGMEASLQTNITRSRYLALIKALKNTAYSDQDYYIPEGRQVVGPEHDEFYPDEDALLKKVIEIFYIRK